MCDSAEPDNFPDRRDLRAVCGGAMTRRKPSACSDRCRAARIAGGPRRRRSGPAGACVAARRQGLRLTTCN